VSSTAAIALPARPFRSSTGAKAILLALLLPFAFWQRRRTPRLARVLVMICALGVLSSCGSSRTIPATGTGGGGGGSSTPAGTSTLTITGSAAGLTRSVNLTVVVQ
jgi:hypothetical protein